MVISNGLLTSASQDTFWSNKFGNEELSVLVSFLVNFWGGEQVGGLADLKSVSRLGEVVVELAVSGTHTMGLGEGTCRGSGTQGGSIGTSLTRLRPPITAV